tara:strand:+ start:274 stop:852 length:579 start_codon:yes stop_codon:yes gene_type:complete
MVHPRLEIIIDKLVPYAIGFILFHLIGIFFFPEFVHNYEDIFLFLDVFLVTFVLGFDVWFKYKRAKNKRYFLRHHWLDIIAVLPFMLVFRIFEEAYLIARFAPLETSIADTQRLMHEVRGVDEVVNIAREAELSGRASRTGMFGKLFRPFIRGQRILRGAVFFEHPLTKSNRKHHGVHYLFYSRHSKNGLKS